MEQSVETVNPQERILSQIDTINFSHDGFPNESPSSS
jgi:hypothetical protein